MIRRWVREGALKSQRFGRTLMIDERDLDKFVQREPVRRFYKISWIRWPSGHEQAEWHFQPRLPSSEEFACGNRGPRQGAKVDQARGVLGHLSAPDGHVCRECMRVARRVFGS
jgi:hypothetical protein